MSSNNNIWCFSSIYKKQCKKLYCQACCFCGLKYFFPVNNRIFICLNIMWCSSCNVRTNVSTARNLGLPFRVLINAWNLRGRHVKGFKCGIQKRTNLNAKVVSMYVDWKYPNGIRRCPQGTPSYRTEHHSLNFCYH